MESCLFHKGPILYLTHYPCLKMRKSDIYSVFSSPNNIFIPWPTNLTKGKSNLQKRREQFPAPHLEWLRPGRQRGARSLSADFHTQTQPRTPDLPRSSTPTGGADEAGLGPAIWQPGSILALLTFEPVVLPCGIVCAMQDVQQHPGLPKINMSLCCPVDPGDGGC